MRTYAINSVIGAVFGTVFVVANCGSLSTPVAVALRVVAVVVLVVVVVRARALRRGATDDTDSTRYGTAFRIVAAAEVAAIVVGVLVVRSAIGDDAIVAWIACVVGVHFFALAAVWREPRFAVLAVAVTACGVVGLVLAGGSTGRAVVDTVSGVVPGFVLLAFAVQAVLTAGPVGNRPAS